MYRLSGKVVIFVREGVIVLHSVGVTYMRELRGIIPYDQVSEDFVLKDDQVQTSVGPYPLGNAYMVQNGGLSQRRTEHFLKHLTKHEVEAVRASRLTCERIQPNFSTLYAPGGYRITHSNLTAAQVDDKGEERSSPVTNGGYKVWAPPID